MLLDLIHNALYFTFETILFLSASLQSVRDDYFVEICRVSCCFCPTFKFSLFFCLVGPLSCHSLRDPSHCITTEFKKCNEMLNINNSKYKEGKPS